jgi:hypothetical protein
MFEWTNSIVAQSFYFPVGEKTRVFPLMIKAHITIYMRYPDSGELQRKNFSN